MKTGQYFKLTFDDGFTYFWCPLRGLWADGPTDETTDITYSGTVYGLDVKHLTDAPAFEIHHGGWCVARFNSVGIQDPPKP